jgi:DNA-binding transcriptional regulator YdaS (Cro superfamily)
MGSMKLLEYLEAERGRSARVAHRLGIAPAYLSQMANGVRPVPPVQGAAIEEATDHEVRRWDLRPHDWHRIWPELISAEGAPEPHHEVASDAA